MTPEERERIEEAHGLWELTIVRLATIADLVASLHPNAPDHVVAVLRHAVQQERETFHSWRRLSEEITSQRGRS